MSSSCFLSIKLPSKEFLCLKISWLIGWITVLIEWIQDLDSFGKILNISCTNSLQKPCFFLSIFITSYSGALSIKFSPNRVIWLPIKISYSDNQSRYIFYNSCKSKPSLATDGKVSFINAITLSQAAAFAQSVSIFPLHFSFCFFVNRLYKLVEQRLW